ncbi:hypothetical protein [Ligilactobacillus acidipiscis]|uniref:hypothetical protein n=1 Tax=Ligilactobacillus acidipiscis TaxID=89059 RepID=UPI0023F8300B|nr:hypothetical protein [Ligilactobacillus acidipiscis]WEV57142.1 hypothetical protein OZX66_00940 [Ligilactobacillus acidipiscis]
MKKKILATLAIVLLFLIMGGIIFSSKKEYKQRITASKQQNTYVTKIKYQQTYTYNADKDYTGDPSYIKFIDSSHYVAIPTLAIKKDPEEDDGPQIDFLQGEYSRQGNKFQLGRNIKDTILLFYTYSDFKKGKFIKEEKKGTQPKTIPFPFAENYLKKKGKYYVYHWRTGSGNYPFDYTDGFVRLKKSKLDIPSTEKEFIQRYHKKQKNQQE